MQDAVTVHRALLEHGVAHEVARLPRPLQTADDLPEVLGLPARSCAVVRCIVATTAAPVPAGGPAGPGPTLHAVVVPAGAQPSPQALRRALGAADTREATAAEINEATDCAARLVTPVGLPREVPVLVDQALALDGTVWIATGESGTAVGLDGSELRCLTGARVVDLTVRAPGPVVVDLTADAPVPSPAPPGDGVALIDLTTPGSQGPPGPAVGRPRR